MRMKENCTKRRLNRAFITIEASLVFVIFIISYYIINTIALSIMTQSLTKKALYETILDISAYSTIADRLNIKDDFSTNEISFDSYKEILLKEFNEEFNLNNLIDNIKNQLLKDFDNFYNNKKVELVVGEIFKQKLKNIAGSKSKFGLISDIDDIKITKASMFEEGNNIALSIYYSLKIDTFNIFDFKDDIEQYVEIDTWIDTKKISNESIWNKSNFERGRYFADKIRHGKENPIKEGIGLDLYDPTRNAVSQVFSLNIFNTYYSENENINENFYEQLKIYYKEMEQNIVKAKGEITLENGDVVKLNKVNKNLLIVLPNEAEKLKFDNTKLKSIGNIELIFMEDAFND